jgi:hypothetical protein
VWREGAVLPAAVQAALTRVMGHCGRQGPAGALQSLAVPAATPPPAASALLTLALVAIVSPAGPDDDDYTGELLPYITGEKQAPLPTYFIGGWGQGSKQTLKALPGALWGWGWWQGGLLPGAARPGHLCISRSSSHSITTCLLAYQQTKTSPRIPPVIPVPAACPPPARPPACLQPQTQM